MRKRTLRSFPVLLTAIWASVAQGTASVSPRSPYTISSSTVHYASATTGTPNLASGYVDTNADFQLILVDDTSATDADRSSMLVFDVSSEKTATALGSDESSDVLVVMAEAQLDDGTFVPIPIAAASDVDSVDSTATPSTCVHQSNCQGQGSDLAGTPAGLYAAEYSEGGILRVGIYPDEVCSEVLAQVSEDAKGCVSGAVDTAFPTSMKIRFIVTVAEDGESIGDRENDKMDAGSTLTLFFQNEGPTFSCPAGVAPASFTDSYFPGDEEILLDTTVFTLDEAASGGAPIDRLLVIGDTGGAPVGTSAGYASSDLLSRVPFGGTETRVRGFDNAQTYSLCFGGRDASGAVGVSGGGADICSCQLDGVDTADIEGFLKESDCFIASASYRSQTAAGVQLLRRFRDRILLRFSAGRAFVDIYYRWSPGAARWLLQNPAMRVPVLALLLPVQAVAWIALNPLAAVGLGLAGAGGTGIALGLRRRRRRSA